MSQNICMYDFRHREKYAKTAINYVVKRADLDYPPDFLCI